MTDSINDEAAPAIPSIAPSPKEAGATAILAEVLIIGLSLGSSMASTCLGLAAASGLSIWRPLSEILSGKSRDQPERPLSEADREARRRFLIVAGFMGLPMVAGAFALGAQRGWAAACLVAALPLIWLRSRFEAQGEARSAAGEIFGLLGMALLAPATVLLGAVPWPKAAQVFFLVLARQIPVLFYLRWAVRRWRDHRDAAKGGTSQVRSKTAPAAMIALAVSVGAAAGLWAAGWLPPAAVGLVAGQALAIIVGALTLAPSPPAGSLGRREVFLGLGYALAVFVILSAG